MTGVILFLVIGAIVVGKVLKAAILWSIYLILLVLIVIGFIIPIFQGVVLGTVSEDIKTWMNWVGIGLSVVSLVLGIVSMVFSSQDGKQSKVALSEIRGIQQDAQTTLNEIKTISKMIRISQEGVVERLLTAVLSSGTYNGGNGGNNWRPDSTGSNE